MMRNPPIGRRRRRRRRRWRGFRAVGGGAAVVRGLGEDANLRRGRGRGYDLVLAVAVEIDEEGRWGMVVHAVSRRGVVVPRGVPAGVEGEVPRAVERHETLRARAVIHGERGEEEREEVALGEHGGTTSRPRDVVRQNRTAGRAIDWARDDDARGYQDDAGATRRAVDAWNTPRAPTRTSATPRTGF